MHDYEVDPKYKHKKDGEPCPICQEPLRENHDNFECDGCGYVDWENHSLPRTGVFIRAKCGSSWGNYDLSELKEESIKAWLLTLPSWEAVLDLVKRLLERA